MISGKFIFLSRKHKFKFDVIYRFCKYLLLLLLNIIINEGLRIPIKLSGEKHNGFWYPEKIYKNF